MKVLYITPFVPYEGIPHAGGYFLYKYLDELHKRGISIHMLAPNSKENEEALSKVPEWINLRLAAIPNKTIAYKVLKLFKLINDPLNQLDYTIVNELQAEEYLNQFDLIDLQYSPTLPLIKIIKQLSNVPVICLEHDVYSQYVKRTVQEKGLSQRKIMAKLGSLRVEKKEREYLNLCDQVYTFSEKDKEILVKMGVTSPIDTFSPALELPQEAATVKENTDCLFVGAMDRPENYEGVRWFISEIWSKILLEIPNAKFIVAGSKPPEWLKTMNSDDIVITGFVEDLDVYYKKAAVFIAPLLSGAGVKFKIVQALAYGLPVVTTEIGAEGINENNEEFFAKVTAEPDDIAAEVIQLMKNASYRESIGKKARNLALDKYDFQAKTINKALNKYNYLTSK
ncbi:glycosyltransferase family 4 protein [Neobacillus niacini]|uniref:glycosyltransferase family 4 protein n=1 Tax=Neobacillus niacini TaxID=86668 RepID=UPI0005EF06CD|nr:glycosyltransferase family 4 protein [Neobacillus niacini]